MPASVTLIPCPGGGAVGAGAGAPDRGTPLMLYPLGGMVLDEAVTGVPDKGAVFWGAVTGVPESGSVRWGAVAGMGAVRPAAVVRTGAVRPAAATVICWLVLQ